MFNKTYSDLVLSRLKANEGSTMAEVLMVTAIAIPLHHFLFLALHHATVQYFPTLSIAARGALDSVIIAAIWVLGYTTTLWVESVSVMGIYFLCLGVGIAMLRNRLNVPKSTKTAISDGLQPPCSVVVDICALFRSGLLLATVMCILAVDFAEVFPVRFAKTANYGESLMDQGVGMIIITSAVVSPFARGEREKRRERERERDRGREVGDKEKRRKQSWWRRQRTPILLTVLASIRTLTVHFSDYQHNIDEYGRDWNFFWTLLSLHLATSLLPLSSLFSLSPLLSLSLPLSLSLLRDAFLPENILLHERDWSSLLDSNREAIWSLPGVVVMWICGVVLGQMCLWNSRRDSRTVGMIHMVRRLCVATVVAGVAYAAAGAVLGPSSRRLFNTTYILSALFDSSLMLLVITFMIHVTGFCADCLPLPPVIHSLSTSQLQVFVLANVLTGLCNAVFQPMYRTAIQGITILIGYVIICAFSAVLMMSRRPQPKSA